MFCDCFVCCYDVDIVVIDVTFVVVDVDVGVDDVGVVSCILMALLSFVLSLMLVMLLLLSLFCGCGPCVAVVVSDGVVDVVLFLVLL